MDETGGIGRLWSEQALLTVDWAWLLLSAKYGSKQTGEQNSISGRSFTLNLLNGGEVKAILKPDGSVGLFCALPEVDLRGVAAEAARLASEPSAGGRGWWETTFETDAPFELWSTHLMRLANEHVRYSGSVAIGDRAHLIFTQANENPTVAVISPDFTVKTRFAIAPPGNGPYAQALALRTATLLRTAIVWLTGAPMNGGRLILPTGPPDDDAWKDRTIGQLPIRPELIVPVDDEARTLPADDEAFVRLQRSLMAYEESVAAGSPSVAVALSVSAMEALSKPNTRWDREKVTKRFEVFIEELIRPELEDMLAHPNCAEAYGAVRSTNALVERLYALRSQIHTGRVGRPAGMLGGSFGDIRLALTSRLARDAVAAFVLSPRSSLIGHPDPDGQAAGSPVHLTYHPDRDAPLAEHARLTSRVQSASAQSGPAYVTRPDDGQALS